MTTKKVGKKIFLKVFLSVILLLIVSYNFYVSKNYLYQAEGDAANFIELGVSLAKNQKYGLLDISFNELMEDFKTGEVGDKDYRFLTHSTWRPPVWPFLMAGVFLFLGYNLLYVLIFKFLLHLGGIYLFYRILKEFPLGDYVVYIGALLYAIHPAWQLYSRVFLSEPITLFFITLWLFFLVRYLNKKNSFWPQAILGGVFILSHPYYIFLPFSVWLFLFLKKQFSFKSFFSSCIICAAVVFVWIIRNSVVLETNNVILTTSSGAVMAKGWNSKVFSDYTNTKGDLADEGLVLKDYEYDHNLEMDEVQRMQLYKNGSLHYIKSNPEMIFPIAGKKIISAFNPFPETPKPGLLEMGRTFFHVLSLFAFLLVLFFSKSRVSQSLVLGLILATVGITILTYSGFRFRMPQIGLELLIIIIGLNGLWESILKLRKDKD